MTGTSVGQPRCLRWPIWRGPSPPRIAYCAFDPKQDRIKAAYDYTSTLYGAAIGEAHLAIGDALQAAEQFEAVLRVVPSWKILHYDCARALERAGDVNGAAMEYRTFLKSWKDADPDASALVDAKERLEDLFSRSP